MAEIDEVLAVPATYSLTEKGVLILWSYTLMIWNYILGGALTRNSSDGINILSLRVWHIQFVFPSMITQHYARQVNRFQLSLGRFQTRVRCQHCSASMHSALVAWNKFSLRSHYHSNMSWTIARYTHTRETDGGRGEGMEERAYVKERQNESKLSCSCACAWEK